VEKIMGVVVAWLFGWIINLVPKSQEDAEGLLRWRRHVAATLIAVGVVGVFTALRVQGIFFGPGFITIVEAETINKRVDQKIVDVENRLNGRIDKLARLTTQIAKRDFAQDARDVRARQCKMDKNADPAIKMQLEADLEADLENYRNLTGREYMIPPCDAF
jgi:hypothetical protein